MYKKRKARTNALFENKEGTRCNHQRRRILHEKHSHAILFTHLFTFPIFLPLYSTLCRRALTISRCKINFLLIALTALQEQQVENMQLKSYQTFWNPEIFDSSYGVGDPSQCKLPSSNFTTFHSTLLSNVDVANIAIATCCVFHENRAVRK